MTPSETSTLFTAQQLRVYPRLLLAVYLVAIAFYFFTLENSVDISGRPFGYDFITFWSAGFLTLQGVPELSFDLQQIYFVQQMAVESGKIYLWHYPPMYHLIVAPLALLPYTLSYLTFVSISFAAFVFYMNHLLAHKDFLVLLLAFPGAWVCIYHGQNTLLSAALLASAIYTIDKRPIVAGILIGLLAYKPQLGLLLPFVLIAAGQWRTFFAASITTLLFVALSTVVLGWELWLHFYENTPLVGEVMEKGLLPWPKMPSLFVSLRLLEVPQNMAYFLHWTCAGVAALTTLYVWRRCGASRLAWATLIPATLLIMPYIFDYVLALLAIPLIILTDDMMRKGTTRIEKGILVLAYFAPLFGIIIAATLHIHLGFFAMLGLFAISARRALADVQTSQTDTLATPITLLEGILNRRTTMQHDK